MSRLIDADKFAELVKRFSESDSFKEDCRKAYNSIYLMLTVDKEKYSPTVFDVEKVVAELEKMRNEDSQGCKDVVGRKCFSYIDCGLCIMDRAIDIVRKGGAE